MQTEKMVSALIGIGVGMIIGTLIAPDKGANTRREISEKGKNYLNELNSEMKELQKKVDKKKEEAKEGIQELSKKEKEVTEKK